MRVFGMRTYVAYCVSDDDDDDRMCLCVFAHLYDFVVESVWKHFGTLFECKPPAFD